MVALFHQGLNAPGGQPLRQEDELEPASSLHLLFQSRIDLVREVSAAFPDPGLVIIDGGQHWMTDRPWTLAKCRSRARTGRPVSTAMAAIQMSLTGIIWPRRSRSW